MHWLLLFDQQRSAVRQWLFTTIAPLPLTPTPLPMGEGLNLRHPGEGRDPGLPRVGTPGVGK